MTTQELSNNIINSMIPCLNPNQVNLLSATLTKELYNYDIIKKNTEIVYNYDDYYSTNELYLKKYSLEKRVQGMSEKTIYQYIYSTRKFLNIIHHLDILPLG